MTCHGLGMVHDPSQPRWKFWRDIKCSECGPGKGPTLNERLRYYYREPQFHPGSGVWTTEG